MGQPPRMPGRFRTYSTAVLISHLLLFAVVFTTELRGQTPASTSAGEEVTITADQQTKSKNIWTLHGKAEIVFRDYTVRADEVTYDEDTGLITATGNVYAEGGQNDERITASHGEYNIKTQQGKFYDVLASTGVRFKGKNVTLTNDYPFIFTGKMVEKTGPDRFVVHHGSVTSCQLPNPKWTFNAERVEIKVGGNAKLYSST